MSENKQYEDQSGAGDDPTQQAGGYADDQEMGSQSAGYGQESEQDEEPGGDDQEGGYSG